MVGKARLILLLLLTPLLAGAEDGCPAMYLVADQTVEWDFAGGSRTDFKLPSYDSTHERWNPTEAAAHFFSDRDLMNIRFDYKTNLLGVPYNVYRFDLAVGDKDTGEVFQKTVDLNGIPDCAGTPPGMMPGTGRIEAFPVKIPPLSSGQPRVHQLVRIRVWGHMH